MNRVWIYQADRIFSDEKSKLVESALADFVSSWTAHGSALAAKGTVRENLFIVLEVDEEQAGVTGCSIDKSVHFLKGLGEQLGVDFFNRMKVSFKDDNGNVHLVGRDEFESLVKSGAVHANTLVFNNLVENSRDLITEWIIPFQKSWHSKVF